MFKGSQLLDIGTRIIEDLDHKSNSNDDYSDGNIYDSYMEQ